MNATQSGFSGLQARIAYRLNEAEAGVEIPRVDAHAVGGESRLAADSMRYRISRRTGTFPRVVISMRRSPKGVSTVSRVASV